MPTYGALQFAAASTLNGLSFFAFTETVKSARELARERLSWREKREQCQPKGRPVYASNNGAAALKSEGDVQHSEARHRFHGIPSLK